MFALRSRRAGRVSEIRNESGFRILTRLQLQAWANIAAARACAVRTLCGAAVWAEHSVSLGDRVVRTSAASTTWGFPKCWKHVCRDLSDSAFLESSCEVEGAIGTKPLAK